MKTQLGQDLSEAGRGKKRRRRKRSAEPGSGILWGVVEDFWRTLNYVPSSGKNVEGRRACTVKSGVECYGENKNGSFQQETSDFIVHIMTDCWRKPAYFTPFWR